MSNCDREDVKKDIFQVTLPLVLSVNCQQIPRVEKAAVSRLAQRPVTAENGSFFEEKKQRASSVDVTVNVQFKISRLFH